MKIVKSKFVLSLCIFSLFLNFSGLAGAAEKPEIPAQGEIGNGDKTFSGHNAPTGASFVPEGLQELLADKTVRLGDRLDIKVYPQQDLSSSRYVDNDGYIFFPYLGKVKAGGLSVDELAKQMQDALGAKYLQNPEVFIWKDAYTKPINVVGEVGHPGAFYPLREDVALIEAISNQGSFLDTADLSEIRVVRLVDGKSQVFLADMGSILDGTTPDLVLKKGDLVIVPKKDNKLIHVLGEVNHPGPININEFLKDKMTLVEALSRAGGFSRSAAANRVRLVRVVDGKETVTKIKADDILKGKEKDVPLKAGDIIVVPEAFW